jgi:hypothetical protein
MKSIYNVVNKMHYGAYGSKRKIASSMIVRRQAKKISRRLDDRHAE